MIIGVMSDSHDNIWKLEKAFSHLAKADVILHCGDIISPFMIVRLIRGTNGKPVHIVWGNNDGDKRMLIEVADRADNIHVHGDYAFLDLDNFPVAINHYPEIARAIAESNRFNLVCYGHDHTAHSEWIGDTMYLNPGELMGMNGRSSIALLDNKSMRVEFVDC